MLSRRGSGDRPGGPPPAGRWTTAPGSEARTDREEEPAMRSGRILIALVIAAIGGLFYFCRTEVNPVTGEKQRVAMSVEQETALGLQTAPQMAAELGGLHPDPTLQNYVEQLGERIVAQSAARGSTYQYDFHLLADPETVNAFALPGGQSSSPRLSSAACRTKLSSPACSATRSATSSAATPRSTSPRHS